MCLVQQLIYIISFNTNYAAQSEINEIIEDETNMVIPNYILENNSILFNNTKEDTHFINSNVGVLDENMINIINLKLQTYIVIYYILHPLHTKNNNEIITIVNNMIKNNRTTKKNNIKYDNNMLYILLCELKTLYSFKFDDVTTTYSVNNIKVSLKLSFMPNIEKTTRHNVESVDINIMAYNEPLMLINNIKIHNDNKYTFKRDKLFLLYKIELLKYVQSLDLKQYYTQYNKKYIEEIRIALLFLIHYDYY